MTVEYGAEEAYDFAASEIHREARWQEELRQRGYPIEGDPRQYFVERLLMVEGVIRGARCALLSDDAVAPAHIVSTRPL